MAYYKKKKNNKSLFTSADSGLASQLIKPIESIYRSDFRSLFKFESKTGIISEGLTASDFK